MTSEAEIILAFIFKRSGKEALKESDIYLPLSLELGWFSTKEAQEFVNHAFKQKLLIKKEGLLTPSFDIEQVNVPVGFSPSKMIFEKKEIKPKEKKDDVFDTIVHLLIDKTKQDKKMVLESIQKIEKEKKVTPEVAALAIASENDIDLKDYFKQIETTLFKESE